MAPRAGFVAPAAFFLCAAFAYACSSSDDAATTAGSAAAGSGGASSSSTGDTSSSSTGGGDSAIPYTPAGCGYLVSAPANVEASRGGDVVGASPTPDHVHLSFPGPTESGFAVNWRTDNDTTVTEILYGPSEADVAAATTAGGAVLSQSGHTMLYSSVLDGSNKTRVHEVHVCGLAPSTRVYYKVGGPGAWSPVFDASSGPAIGSTEAIRFAVLGDSRDDPEVFAELQEQIGANAADFQLFTGDAVQTGLAQNDWNDLFEAKGAASGAAGVLARTPLMMSNGNHDALAVNYLVQFALPQDESVGETPGGEEWYSFNYGNVHVVVLNDTTTNSSIESGVERDFLEADLAAVDRAKTPWVFAVHHRPLYSCSNHGSDTGIRADWQPLYDQYQVDIVFNGHDHNYERSFPIRGLSGGEGVIAASQGPNGAPVDNSGTTYIVAGGAGAPLYGSGTCPHTYLSESVRNYALVDIQDKTLSFKAYRLDGSLLDSFDISK